MISTPSWFVPICCFLLEMMLPFSVCEVVKTSDFLSPRSKWQRIDYNFVNILLIQSKAKEMMELAEKMRQKLLTNQSNSNDEEMGSKQDMQDLLLSVGIVSPVTKETAGALYHQQLSRQVLRSLIVF